MKKVTWKLMILTGIISFSLAACGSGEDNNTPDEKQNAETSEIQQSETEKPALTVNTDEKRMHGAETGEVDSASKPVITDNDAANDLNVKSNEKFDIEEVLNKHLKAMRQDKLENVKTLKITGVASQNGMEMKFTRLVKKPNKSRFEAEFPSRKMIQIYNGKDGWKYASWTKAGPEPVSDQELQIIKMQSTIEALLANWKTKFESVKPAGIVDFEGHEVYKLKVEIEPGKIAYFMIDKNDYLLRGVINVMEIRGQTIENVSVFKNYKKTNGIPEYHLVETKANGEVYSTMKIDNYQYDIDISDNMFEKSSIK